MAKNCMKQNYCSMLDSSVEDQATERASSAQKKTKIDLKIVQLE